MAGIRWRVRKVVKQSYDALPNIVKGGGDGVHTPDMLTGGGMPAIQGLVRDIGGCACAGRHECPAVGRSLRCQDRQAAGRLGDHILRRNAGHPGCDRTSVEVRQAGEPRERARCDPGDKSQDPAGRYIVRCQRRHKIQDRVGLPGACTTPRPRWVTWCISSSMSVWPQRPDKSAAREVQQLPVPGKPRPRARVRRASRAFSR